MADSLKTSWDEAHGNENAPTQKRRKRRPLNCWHCRIRKIKCDRGSPCSACLKSGDAATCSYIVQESGKQDILLQASTPGIEARINRLENLVRSVASSKTGPGNEASALSPPDSTDGGDDLETKELTSKIGSMKVDSETDRTYYLGPSHWVSIISEVEELKDYIGCEVQVLEKEAWDNYMYLSQAHVSLLRGLNPAPTREELLSWMPPRIVADMTINKFFASTSPTVALLHAPTFKEQCAQHWADPSKTPLAWLAMFYALLYISEVTIEMDDHWVSGTQVMPGSETKGLYRMLTMKCLLASNYTRPRSYTLEAMLLLLGGDYMTSSDAIDDTTLMVSLLIRSAIKMGLHRSYPHPDLSPFQREMRRRLWVMIHCMDIMHAIQVSLPPNIHQEDVDLTPPSNLHDNDFGPTSTSLPPSRPLTEITPITYYLIKYKHCLALDKIIKFSESTSNPSRDQLKPYEELVLETTRSIPPRLQLDFATETVSEVALLRMQRVQLDRLTQFNTCILYWRFLPKVHSDQKLWHYRRSCIDASMRILRAQDETCARHPDRGVPDSVRKRRLMTITSVDFYTAGMAIAMDIYHGLKAEPAAPKASDIKIWGFDRRPEMMDALQRSTEYWALAKSESIDAAKAWAAFGFVLKKARAALSGKDDVPAAQMGGPDVTPVSLIDDVLDPAAFPVEFPDGEVDWGVFDGITGYTDDAEGAFLF